MIATTILVETERVDYKDDISLHHAPDQRVCLITCSSAASLIQAMHNNCHERRDDLVSRIETLKIMVRELDEKLLATEEREQKERYIEEYSVACKGIIGLLRDEIWCLVRTTFERRDCMTKTTFFDFVSDRDEEFLSRLHEALHALGLDPSTYEELLNARAVRSRSYAAGFASRAEALEFIQLNPRPAEFVDVIVILLRYLQGPREASGGALDGVK
jgi:hypothetical protein